LEELHEVVLKNDLAWCCGDVSADLEGGLVGHGDLEPALALLQVGQ
jgi:hypothetical protein